MGEMSGVMIAMIKIEEDLCIFYEGRRKDIKDKATNTENLVPAVVNKVILY
jgi:hypothetical protein